MAMHGTEEASNDGMVRVCIIHGLNISHKELTYLLQKSISYRNKVLHACSQGDRLVGKDHRSSPAATHNEDNQRNTSCFKFVTQRLPYVHATGLANLNTSISQIHKYLTSMTLISPSSYLKTIIKYQTSHSIQCTLYESFYYIPLGCLSYQGRWDRSLISVRPKSYEGKQRGCNTISVRPRSQSVRPK